MTGVNEFIIEIGDAFDNTIKHGSLELYKDHRTSQQEQSNRNGTVVCLPINGESDVQVGAEVIIDPTVLFQQTYKGKTQDSQFLVDREKGWYRVSPQMLLVYKNPNETNYTGYKDNLFAEALKQEEVRVGSIYLPKAKNELEGVAVVAISNKELIDIEDIKQGSVIYYQLNREWEFELEGKTYLYLKNIYVLGKKEV